MALHTCHVLTSKDAWLVHAHKPRRVQRCHSGPSHHTIRSMPLIIEFCVQKVATERKARACATVHLGPQAFDLVRHNQVQKGDVLTTAQLAGIMGAKATSNLIPLCHPLMISKADVQLHLESDRCCIQIVTDVSTSGQTGVEMEALTAASVAALTVYDMCKAISKDAVITDIHLLHKSGGKSGTFDWVPASQEPNAQQAPGRSPAAR